jgi:hypothetical protein
MAPEHDATDRDNRWPKPLQCGQCQREVPADEAIHPEGQDYTLAFCSPACHTLWRDAQGPLGARHRDRSGRE